MNALHREAQTKLRQYAAAHGGFEVVDDPHSKYIGVRPTGGTLVRLTPVEAGVFLTGFITGRRSTQEVR